jgi:ABC-type branched-subunit amino acid transport system substrate-binding protein
MASIAGRGIMMWRLVRAAACAAVLMAGTAVPAGAQGQAARIAVAVSLNGSGDSYGQPSLDGARLAVEEQNEGGVGASGAGPSIALAVYDDTSNDDRARAVAREIIASDALAVVGPATTGMALAAGPTYAEGGLVSIGTTATGDGTTAAATTFRASFSTSDGGEALANYLRHVLGGDHAIVLTRNDGYGQPFVAGFRRVATRLGIETEYLSFTTAAEADEVARRVAAVPDATPIVLGMLIGDAVPVLRTLRRAGSRGTILGTNAIAGEFLADAFAGEPEVRQNPGFFTDGVYAASSLIFDSANAEGLAFAQRFRARFGREPSYIAMHGYESARLAIAAARAAVQAGGDLRTQRAAVRAFLIALDGPANAVPGLNGPIWFTAGRGRIQALRIGRFTGTQFASAPVQLVPVPSPDAAELASGELVEIAPQRLARRQQVVYTGIFLNEISRLDIAQGTFTADFYVWLRFARGVSTAAADPTVIEFPNLLRGNFDPAQPAEQIELDDGTTYRLWQVRGDFKNDYDLHRYPADTQTLAMRFFNARAASDRIVYVQDRRPPRIAAGQASALAGTAGGPGAAHAGEMSDRSTEAVDQLAGAAPQAFRNLTQWDARRVGQGRDTLVTESALGNVRLVGLERVRELSGFGITVDLHRRIVATLAKTLLPLGIMALIMLAALYFPHALVKEKVTVAITGALSGAVLLGAVNAQLGAVGYTMAIEYVFYIFFALCLLSIMSVLIAERLRVAGAAVAARRTEVVTRLMYLLTLLATVATATAISGRW